MIKNRTPISMAESLEYLKEKHLAETKAFIKKFTKLDETKGKKLREKLVALDFIKLNDKSISKLIDVLPEKKEELNKTLADSNLDEDEITKVLQTIKEFI